MAKLDVHMCPETGICSIMNDAGGKIDMIANEVDQLRQAADNPQQFKEVLARVDASFADSLTESDLQQLASDIK